LPRGGQKLSECAIWQAILILFLILELILEYLLVSYSSFFILIRSFDQFDLKTILFYFYD